MGNYGLAALAGLLGGGGKGLYEGFGAGTEDALNQQKLAQQQSQFNDLNFTKTNELVPGLRDMLSPGTDRVRNTLMPVLERAREKMEAEQKFRERQSAISAMPQEMTPDQLVREYLKIGPTAPEASILNQYQKSSAPEDVAVQFREGKLPDQPGNQVLAFRYGKKTGQPMGTPQATGAMGAGSKNATLAVVEQYLENPTKENHQKMSAMLGTTMVPPGGAAVPKADLVGIGAPAGTPAAPGGMQAPNPSPVYQRAAIPSGGAQEDVALLDTARDQVDSILKRMEGGKMDRIMGGVGKNPMGAINRVRDRFLGDSMTSEERGGMAEIAIQMQKVKHALIGSQRTSAELKDLAASIPDENSFLTGDTPAQVIPKLRALKNLIETERGSRENVMGSVGTAVPARPPARPQTAPATPAPAAPAGKWKEGQRLFSPSQKRYFVIQGGVPVPE